MSPATPAEIRRAHRVYWIELILAWAGLCAGIIWSTEYAETFQYARDAAWIQWVCYASLAVLTLGCFAALRRWQPRIAPPHMREGLNLLLTMLVAFCLYALMGVVPIKLHRMSDPQPLTTVESVDPSYFGWSRNCKHRAWIQGDTPLHGVRLCVRDLSLYEQLAASKRIELTATRSRYGIAIQDFRAAPAAQNP
ncbi:hypothetical protein [Pseudomonas sp. CGJS7]|uniref:hypothetical protein n=1 Tax=Pseudomonas sp. CGJS7 TaxID=3109348 RepID=UPI0030089B21